MALRVLFGIQSLAAKVDLCIPSGSLNISVISQPKWLKFGLQAHLFMMFGHTKFQLSITCTFRLMKLLVEITKYLHFKFDDSESKSDRELKFCVSKHLQKMCLETKFQPFRLRNDGDIEGSTWPANDCKYIMEQVSGFINQSCTCNRSKPM